MKILVALSCIFTLTNAYSLSVPPSLDIFSIILENAGLKNLTSCVQEIYPEKQISKDDPLELDEVIKELVNDNLKLACVTECVMKTSGYIIEDGKMNPEQWTKLIQSMSPKSVPTYVDCVAKIEIHSCQELNKFEECDKFFKEDNMFQELQM